MNQITFQEKIESCLFTITKNCNFNQTEVYQILGTIMPQYSYNAGVRLFVNQTQQEALKELKQLHTKDNVKPILALVPTETQ